MRELLSLNISEPDENGFRSVEIVFSDGIVLRRLIGPTHRLDLRCRVKGGKKVSELTEFNSDPRR
jgi:hypothetical protein